MKMVNALYTIYIVSTRLVKNKKEYEMRPEKFRYEMNKAFDQWFETKTVDAFKPLLREMNRVWVKWAKEENDNRTGIETYGYETSHSIRNNMHYMSDRWRCAYRLKWLFDGINQEKIV